MEKVIKSIFRMKAGAWYPEDRDLTPKWVAIYKKAFDVMEMFYDIELTFNSDYTKIKKTIWKNGKPQW